MAIVMLFSKSRGPSSSLIGVPFNSQSLNFLPGRMSLSSMLTLNPAASKVSLISPHFARTSSFPFLNRIGIIVTWLGDTFGGKRNPFSSP